MCKNKEFIETLKEINIDHIFWTKYRLKSGLKKYYSVGYRQTLVYTIDRL